MENELPPREGQLTLEEKRFLVAVERGDLASTRRYLENAKATNINVNCTDPLGRSALLMAIDNENLEMVALLIFNQVETKDALLHAINEEYVEAVEVLLEHEEAHHIPGTPHIIPFCIRVHKMGEVSAYWTFWKYIDAILGKVETLLNTVLKRTANK